MTTQKCVDTMNRDQALEDLRSKIVRDTDVPETVRNFLENGADLEEIRLDQHGSWWHEGEIFENERLSLLFHRSLKRTKDGNWVLHVEPYTYPVLVDLCGTFVTRIIDTSQNSSTVRLADRSTATLDLDSVYTDGDTVLAVVVGDKPARIVDTAYRQLTGGLKEVDGGYAIEVDGSTHALSPLPDGFFDR